MTKQEMRKIWGLLEKYRPGDKRLKDKDLMTVWWQTFGSYEMGILMNALAAHFREKSFWPDIKEISALLPPLPGSRSEALGATIPGQSWIDRFSRRWNDMMAAQNIPSLEAWLAQGKPAAEWWRFWGRCQLQDQEYMALLTPMQREQLKKEVGELGQVDAS